MGLDLEKLMGCSKAAMIYDSNEFWKWDGHSAVFGCYASTKHSLHKATHCAVRISLDQGSSFVLESFVVQHLTAVEQTWSAAAFLLPSNSAPVWDPAASLVSFWKPHKREGKFFTAPHRLLKNPVWFSSLEIHPWAHHLSVHSELSRVLVSVAGTTSDLTAFLSRHSLPGQICTEQTCSAAQHMRAGFSFWIVKLKILSM